ncbi:hypothetical protein [Nostoc sp. MG11]|uniref:hypothetical protein n=1 Tax=Nostoc sp. MG11 TaxID=2721166 RepID=UPI0018685DA3|nr:hypothetical protein [Nostoc sp. MG11]
MLRDFQACSVFSIPCPLLYLAIWWLGAIAALMMVNFARISASIVVVNYRERIGRSQL